eukprot:11179881-Lingulodinium_polyedra.AAC.1
MSVPIVAPGMANRQLFTNAKDVNRTRYFNSHSPHTPLQKISRDYALLLNALRGRASLNAPRYDTWADGPSH